MTTLNISQLCQDIKQLTSTTQLQQIFQALQQNPTFALQQAVFTPPTTTGITQTMLTKDQYIQQLEHLLAQEQTGQTLMFNTPEQYLQLLNQKYSLPLFKIDLQQLQATAAIVQLKTPAGTWYQVLYPDLTPILNKLTTERS